MFGRSKPIPFDPYGRGRPRWGVPRWLLLWLGGMVAGASGVLYVQARHLPPRLSVVESAQLQSAYAKADVERTRLQRELADTQVRLQSAMNDKRDADGGLHTARGQVQALRSELNTVVDLLPPDPRGGSVEVRAAQIEAKGGQLTYDVVLTGKAPAARPSDVMMKLVVAGETARGTPTSITLAPVAVKLGGHEVVSGSQPLGDGFKPRQTTVQVLDRAGEKQLGMRVLRVQ